MTRLAHKPVSQTAAARQMVLLMRIQGPPSSEATKNNVITATKTLLGATIILSLLFAEGSAQ